MVTPLGISTFLRVGVVKLICVASMAMWVQSSFEGNCTADATDIVRGGVFGG